MALGYEQIKGILKTHKGRANGIDYKKWDKYRSWYGSHFWAEGEPQPTGSGDTADTSDEDLTFEQNYPFAFLETMISNVVPTNPQVTLTARASELRDSANVRQAMINDSFKRARLHKHLWQLATYAGLYGRGFMKAVWNIRRNQPDYIPIDPHFIFFDMSASRWEDIRYIAEITVLTKKEFESRVKGKGKSGFYNSRVADQAAFTGYPIWLQDKAKDKSLINDASRDVFEWVTVYEFYDFTDPEGRYYHFLEDGDKPLFRGKLPYKAIRNPYGLLTFNENLIDIGGLSDIQLIAPLQERLNEMDTLELWHAQSTIPILLLHSGLVDRPEQFKQAYRDATEPGAVVSVEGKPEMPIHDLFTQTPVPTLSPSFDKMRQRAIESIEYTLAIPAYARGAVGNTDVATEVALADSAVRTRNGRRQKEIYDLVAWCGRSCMGLYEEFLAKESRIPVRVSGDPEALEITRDTIKARDLDTLSGEEPLQYDYDSVPYSPTENNRLLQLRNLREHLDFLIGNQFVDQQKLTIKLLDLLMIGDIVQDKPEEQQQPMEGQMPPGAPMGPAPGQGDTLAGGAMPAPGAEMPPNAGLSPMGGPGAPAPAGQGAAPLSGFPPGLIS